MTETKWKNGPWRVDINQLGRHIRNNDGVIFTAPRVTYFEGQSERYENDLAAQHAALHLGAAAPDLYAALDWVENGIPAECFRDDETTQVVFTGKDLKAFAKARRKARGE